MSKEYIWEVKARNTPLLKRKCNHCEYNRFYCSEKFRINAQKKNIDIYLIYRCIKCDNTYNMAILTRTKPTSISKDLLNKFSGNDTETAWIYAFSKEISKKNNVELDFKSVEYFIQYDNISVEDIVNFDNKIASFRINYPFDFNLKLSSVIRTCFNLSANRLNELIEAKVISVCQKYLQKKHKVKNEDIVYVEREKLKRIYHIWLRQ